MSFKAGDKVKWESQAGGVSLEKVGTIVIVVPPNTWIRSVNNASAILATSNAEAIDNTRASRKAESYVVQVESANRRARPKLYWPVAKRLTLVP